MKRLIRDMVTLCVLLLFTFLLNRAGVYASLAARLEPAEIREADPGVSTSDQAPTAYKQLPDNDRILKEILWDSGRIQ